MKKSNKFCSKCGAEIAEKKAKACAACGAKLSKPLYKRWWFWTIIVLVLAAIGSGIEEIDPVGEETTKTNISSQNTYEEVDLQEMFDELHENAMRAEKNYQNKLVSITGKIRSFDSDGAYISLEPVDASGWNLETMKCYVSYTKKEEQLEVLLSKSKGDVVTIKGKVTSIGEVLGYSIYIDEIQ